MLTNIIIYFYQNFQNLGIAILVFTILLKILLLPLDYLNFKQQKKMEKLNEKIKEIQKKYKIESEEFSKEIAKFYKEERVNPFLGIILMVIQVIILAQIYNSINSISKMQDINSLFLGIDLKQPSFYFFFPTLIATFLPLISIKNIPKFYYFILGLVIVILAVQPSGILLYWFLFSIFSFLENLIFKKYIKS
jgi:YidC/Oxa1 family membrane protein insertase